MCVLVLNLVSLISEHRNLEGLNFYTGPVCEIC